MMPTFILRLPAVVDLSVILIVCPAAQVEMRHLTVTSFPGVPVQEYSCTFGQLCTVPAAGVSTLTPMAPVLSNGEVSVNVHSVVPFTSGFVGVQATVGADGPTASVYALKSAA